jgi:hypothetical protein
LAVLLTASVQAAVPTGVNSKTAPSQTDYVKVTCKVFVTEAGEPKTVEVLSIEPSLASSTRAAIEKLASQTLLTWTFTPNQESGTPVAGYLVVPVNIDLADPIPTSGT